MTPKPEILNPWQRGVPVGGKIFTPAFILLLVFAVIGIGFAIARTIYGLGPYTGMSSAYAWGVWKTFNVMTLTALGSGGLAVGIAAWVFDRHELHVVMRTALITSFLFYLFGLIGLAIDVGRPWNMYHLMFPWRWNTHSALFEVALAMPVYCIIFLGFENAPAFFERVWYTGSSKWRDFAMKIRPAALAAYPFMIAGAYLLPLGHQSSLGALMMLGGDKVHPLWQTQMLPLLYVIQAAICGFAFVIFILQASALTYKRPIDMRVVASLASFLSYTVFIWIGLRALDLTLRGAWGYAFEPNYLALVFWIENLALLIPAVAFMNIHVRHTAMWTFKLAVMATFGGMLYRFTPTAFAYHPSENSSYFPTVPEFMITVGLISAALAAYTVAVKKLAILPAPSNAWYHQVDEWRLQYPEEAAYADHHY